MYRAFYEGMTLSHLPLFSLVLFFAVFTGALLRTFWLRKAADFDAVSRLPIGDDHHE